MTEFDDGSAPELSMVLPLEDFERTVFETGELFSDELVYGIYQKCLDESALSDPEDESVRIKRGLLHQASGDIEHRQGEHQNALLSYAQAREELADYDPLRLFALEVNEAHMRLHDLGDVLGSIPPYETATRLYEDYYVGNEARVAPLEIFSSYTDILGHLAAAYTGTGRDEEARTINRKIAAFGALPPAVFGFEQCEHFGLESIADQVSPEGEQLCQEIKAVLNTEADADNREQYIERLQAIEALVDSENFLPDMPEQRALVLQTIYFRYGMVLADAATRSAYLTQALDLAKKYDFPVTKVDMLLTIGENQILAGEPLNKQIQTLRKAFLAMEECLNLGIAAEIAQTDRAALRLAPLLVARKDFVGLERLRRRLAARGMKLHSNAPGAQNPDLN